MSRTMGSGWWFVAWIWSGWLWRSGRGKVEGFEELIGAGLVGPGRRSKMRRRRSQDHVLALELDVEKTLEYWPWNQLRR